MAQIAIFCTIVISITAIMSDVTGLHNQIAVTGTFTADARA